MSTQKEEREQMVADSSQQDISHGSSILGEAGAGRTSVESLKSDTTPPVMTSTPVGSDSDEYLDHLDQLYAANQRQIQYLKEQRRKQKAEKAAKSNYLTLQLYEDDTYETKEYDLNEEQYQNLPPLQYMKVAMAKMTFHMKQSAEAYEQAYKALSTMKEREAANEAFLQTPRNQILPVHLVLLVLNSRLKNQKLQQERTFLDRQEMLPDQKIKILSENFSPMKKRKIHFAA